MPVPADWQWLTSDEAQHWLRSVADSSEPLHVQVKRLRKDLSIEQTQRILDQVSLRRRASTRFSKPDSMFFTEKGLQQATDSTLAQYKASRFGNSPVIDLCCGIGGDLMAIAERGPVLGIDRDPLSVLLANASLRRQGPRESAPRDAARQAMAAIADVEQLSVLPEVAIHVDPDRRPAGRRSTRIDAHSPSRELLARWVNHSQGLAIKLAPATDTDDALLAEAELEWLGHRRACQQLVAWYGPLATRPGVRRATIIDAAGSAHSLEGCDDEADLPMTSTVGAVVVEPAPAVLAADLASEVARRLQLESLTAGGGYLTADNASLPELWNSVFWTSFDVVETMPFRSAKLKSHLRTLNIGTVEIKTRGVAENTSRLQKELSRPGGEPAVVFIYKQGARTVCTIARRRAVDPIVD